MGGQVKTMLIIANATISSGENDETSCVHIVVKGEKISGILSAEDSIPLGADVIDASGLLVLPGGIDPHVHFNTPGYEDREDFTSASMNAAAGGTTTVIDMPETCIPEVTNLANFKKKVEALSDKSVIDFALWAGVSGNSMRDEWWCDEMDALWDAGVIGFKTYMISGMDTFRSLSFIEIGQVMQKASDIGALVGVHAEDRDFIDARTAELKGAGEDSLMAYYESRADPAEKNGVAAAVRLGLTTHASIHIVHVASRAAAAQIIAARGAGLDVTSETCPHYLAFTYDDFERYGSALKCAPVVKMSEDRDALWRFLAVGDINFLATDHAPCDPAQKDTGSAWTDYGGMPGVEWRIPYLFSEGYKKGRLTLSRMVDATSTAAAKRYGLADRKGAIAVGLDADFVFIDPDRAWVVKGESFGGRGHLTPFAGWEFTGKVVRTICRGRVIYDEIDGIDVEAGYGKFLKRG
jgi:allantoinase